MKNNSNQSEKIMSEHKSGSSKEMQNVGEWIDSSDADDSFERLLNSML